MSWRFIAGANGLTALAYLAISFAILRPLLVSGQLRSNPLGLTTAAIFFTGAVHHGHHAVHMLLPVLGQQVEFGLSLRQAWRWDIALWDMITAGAGVVYWMQRRRYGPLIHGAQLFDDLRERQHQALEINDNIVQGLTVAQMAFELDQTERGEEAVRKALVSARKITSEMLGDAPFIPGPGDLRRSKPAVVR